MNKENQIKNIKKQFPNWEYVESAEGLKFRNGPLPKGDTEIKFSTDPSHFQSKRKFTVKGNCLYFGV